MQKEGTGYCNYGHKAIRFIGRGKRGTSRLLKQHEKSGDGLIHAGNEAALAISVRRYWRIRSVANRSGPSRVQPLAFS